MSRTIKSCTLHFLGGNTDELYKLSIQEGDVIGTGIIPSLMKEKYRVFFEYGRQGSELRAGEKTPGYGVKLEEADAIYQKCLSEKAGEGYRRSTASTVLIRLPVIPPSSNPTA